MLECGDRHGLNFFSREIGFGPHDLPGGIRRVRQHIGKGLLFASLFHELDDEVQPVAIGKGERLAEENGGVFENLGIVGAIGHLRFHGFDQLG